MTALLAIGATALLFVLFGALRRGREPERCGSCTGGCSSCEHPAPTSLSDPS